MQISNCSMIQLFTCSIGLYYISPLYLSPPLLLIIGSLHNVVYFPLINCRLHCLTRLKLLLFSWTMAANVESKNGQGRFLLLFISPFCVVTLLMFVTKSPSSKCSYIRLIGIAVRNTLPVCCSNSNLSPSTRKNVHCKAKEERVCMDGKVS